MLRAALGQSCHVVADGTWKRNSAGKSQSQVDEPGQQSNKLHLRHCTVVCRRFNGVAELLVEMGGSDGPAYIRGENEIRALAEKCDWFLEILKKNPLKQTDAAVNGQDVTP